jgi:hypothetical protein
MVGHQPQRTANNDVCWGTRDDRHFVWNVWRTDPQGVSSDSGMSHDLSLPFPSTRAGAPDEAHPRDRRDARTLRLPANNGMLRREGWHVNVKRVHRPAI